MRAPNPCIWTVRTISLEHWKAAEILKARGHNTVLEVHMGVIDIA